MVGKTIAEFRKIDFLMNDAGIVKWYEVGNINEEDWMDVINMNLNGLFYCCQEVGKQIIKQGGGRIINIASMSGLIVNWP